MHNRFEEIEIKLVDKIYKVFLIKFDGNKSKFAKASLCSETTVRRVLGSKQRMTLELFLRFCNALDINVKEIFNDIDLK
jgi:DNA-binding Xre family transcriptional regulator